MFNLTTLKQLEADVGAEVLTQLMTVFCQESAKFTEQIMATTSLDEEAVRLSHSLKSCARSYGADELADLATVLEAAAKEQSTRFFEQRSKLPALQDATVMAAKNI